MRRVCHVQWLAKAPPDVIECVELVRRGQDEQAARFQTGMNRSKKRGGVGHVLDGLEAHRGVECAVSEILYKALCKRKVFDAVLRCALPGELYRQGCNVDSYAFSDAWGHRAQDQSFRAANVQHLHISSNPILPHLLQRVSCPI